MISPSPTTLTTETHALIEEHIRRLLQATDCHEVSVTCTSKKSALASSAEPASPPGLELHIAIDAPRDGRLLIGVRGTHLAALQHLIRTILRRQLETPHRITVDVNGYVAARERTLAHLAEEAARKAGKTGRAITLPPMNAADRHTVHTHLAPRHDINTASLGDEPNRRVVVRPVFV